MQVWPGDKQVAWKYIFKHIASYRRGSGAAVAQNMKPHITWCISVHWKIKSPFACLAPSSDRSSLRYQAPLSEITNFHSSLSCSVFWITTFTFNTFWPLCHQYGSLISPVHLVSKFCQFFMSKQTQPTSPDLVLVQHWEEEETNGLNHT